jgi:hypothetical protein
MMGKGSVLLLLALSGVGCLSPGSRVEVESRQTQPVRLTEAPPPPPPVITADQVNDGNATDIIQALNREMDYETNNQQATMPIATTMANPMKR